MQKTKTRVLQSSKDLSFYATSKSISGTIKKLFFQKENFSAGIIEFINITNNMKGTNFSINTKVELGQTVTLNGQWTNHPQYGWQFQATHMTNYIPANDDLDGLTKYLADSKVFEGIGVVKAGLIARLAHELANGDLQALLENVSQHETILTTCKITIEQLNVLREEWTRNIVVNKLTTELMGMGLTQYQASIFITKYGMSAIDTIKENPYLIIKEDCGIGFKKADMIAIKANFPRNSPLRIKAGIEAYLKENESQGHTYITKADLFTGSKSLIGFLSLEGERQKTLDIVENMIRELVREKVVHIEYVGEKFQVSEKFQKVDSDYFIAFKETFAMESYVVRKCHKMARRKLNDWEIEVAEIAIAEIEAARLGNGSNGSNNNSITLNTDQQNAIKKCLTSPIFAIHGGAGTGKTFLIKTLINYYKSLSIQPLSVVLLAPTGTAADRITESTGFRASTIHRFLASLEAQEIDIAPVDIILIDEFSMVSLELLYRLLMVVNGEKTKIIFVGDKDQLPAIGLGHLIRDAIEMGTDYALQWFSTAKLSIVQRQAGLLKQASVAILSGRLYQADKNQLKDESFYINDHKTFAGNNTYQPLQPYYLIKPREMDQLECFKNIYKYYNGVLEQTFGINLITQIQMLTAQHNGLLGTKCLNATIQAIIQRETHFTQQLNKILAMDKYSSDYLEQNKVLNIKEEFYIGDKVCWTQNNYKLNPPLMNGTMGIITNILHNASDKGQDVYVMEFNIEGKAHTYQIEKGTLEAEQFMLAYALTVHKYQGKEIPIAMVVCHKAHSFSHSRNWLYTAMTRARKSLILLGDSWAIDNAISKLDVNQRKTLTQYIVGKL